MREAVGEKVWFRTEREGGKEAGTGRNKVSEVRVKEKPKVL